MNPLSEIIRHEIGQCGVLSFARFMELALYCPKHGYYETKKDNPGRRGDFYTSVGVGELFGQLLATRFAGWLEGSVPSPQSRVHSPDSAIQIVEAGAHDGRLAKDILGWLRTRRPELFGKMEYWIVEPSAVRQEWQQETLKDFSPRVRWLQRFNASTLQRFNGIIFCNELLDAMPVRRFGWDAAQKTWFEWGVTVDGEKFVWAKVVNAECGMRNAEFNFPSSLLEVLPDGYTIEFCPAAESWWREAANVLEHGKLMTIDYGLTADELFSPGRPNGTLRCYYRHQVSDDVLVNPGQQDITAHVNFPAIQQAGEEAGLKTESFQTQAQFLTQILAEALKSNSTGEWNLNQTREFQTLTHPEHLGRAFRVLVQSQV